MADISSVYGKDFQKEAKIDSAKYAAKLIANNIAHKEYVFRYNSEAMWSKNNMIPEAIQYVISVVHTINNSVSVCHIDKTSNDINMFPYLINGPV